MAAQGQSVDTFEALFGNPVVRAALALLTVVTAIVRYVKESGERQARAATVSNRYDLHGPVFWLINRAPHAFHRLVAVCILIIAILEVAVFIDHYTLSGSAMALLPDEVQAAVGAVLRHFVALFLGALLLYILFETRALERFVSWLLGLFPATRQSLGWANAQWQISGDADERRILTPSENHVENAASQLLDELVAGNRNPNLALRPTTLTDDNAANVLYFGHVVEEHLASAGISLPWTTFYEALAAVAETVEAPFSPEGIEQFNPQKPFLTVLLQANAHMGAKIPNNAALEHTIEKAFKTLKNRWAGDARNMAKAFLCAPSYWRILRSSASFLVQQGTRRQFAKLFILWNILPGTKRPEVFRIPFSTRMLVRYLDLGVARSEGDHFDFTGEPVQVCFEAIQQRILSRVFRLLEDTKDESRVKWREAEKKDVASRRLDWTWWVYYRADQQAYHDARGYESENWKIEGNKEIVAA
jgi:hypothetical protein